MSLSNWCRISSHFPGSFAWRHLVAVASAPPALCASSSLPLSSSAPPHVWGTNRVKQVSAWPQSFTHCYNVKLIDWHIDVFLVMTNENDNVRIYFHVFNAVSSFLSNFGARMSSHLMSICFRLRSSWFRSSSNLLSSSWRLIRSTLNTWGICQYRENIFLLYKHNLFFK